MNPGWAPLTNRDKVRILRMLAAGDSVPVVATAVGMTSDRILSVAKHHGYPDRGRISFAVELLEAAKESITADANRELGDEATRAIVARGRKGTRAKTRALAEKVVETLKALQVALDGEEAERLAAAAAAERKAREAAERDARDHEAREEVRRLEDQLKAARAKLAKSHTTGPSAGTSTDPKKVRAWATTNGIACPTHGRVPRAVVEQYLAAGATS